MFLKSCQKRTNNGSFSVRLKPVSLCILDVGKSYSLTLRLITLEHPSSPFLLSLHLKAAHENTHTQIWPLFVQKLTTHLVRFDRFQLVIICVQSSNIEFSSLLLQVMDGTVMKAFMAHLTVLFTCNSRKPLSKLCMTGCLSSKASVRLDLGAQMHTRQPESIDRSESQKITLQRQNRGWKLYRGRDKMV